jgi:segregation and condensation protein A
MGENLNNADNLNDENSEKIANGTEGLNSENTINSVNSESTINAANVENGTKEINASGLNAVNSESTINAANAENGAKKINANDLNSENAEKIASGAEGLNAVNAENTINSESTINTANVENRTKEINASGLNAVNSETTINAANALQETDDGAGFLHSGFRQAFKLRIFEGPLDLLLALIREAKIDIKDIFVSEITNQYIEYVAQMDALDLDYISEFIEMAATILEIKSKKLLPKIEKEKTDEEVRDEEWLIRRLQEYKIFKETAEVLKKQETLDVFYREPDYNENDYKTVFKNFSMEKLVEAFAVILHREGRRGDENLTRKIIRERFTVANRVIFITELLRDKRKINFFSLFDDDYSKLEIINIFLAVLEILKKQLACAEQDEYYSDIFLTAAKAIDGEEDGEETKNETKTEIDLE